MGCLIWGGRSGFTVRVDRPRAPRNADESQYTGRVVQTSDTEIIEVRLREIDNEERVVLVDRVE